MPPHDPTPDTSAPDPKSFLLPKKEGGPSVDSAERVDAANLLKQEEAAKVGGIPPTQSSERTIPTPVGFGGFPTGQVPAGVVPSPSNVPAGEAPTIGERSVPAAPPPPKKEEAVVKAIETYGSDINRVVQSGDVSMVTVAAAEAERRARSAAGEPVAPQPLGAGEQGSPMRPVLIIAGSIFLLCAVGIAAALLLRPAPAPPPGSPQAPLVEVDQTVLVPYKEGDVRDVLMIRLEAARQQANLSLGLIERLYVAEATTSGATPDPLPAQQFLGVLVPDIPGDLLRTILPTYLVGIHSYDQNQAFLVLRVDSYQVAYAGMLAWEPTMERDLLPLFTRTPPVHLQTGVGTSTASTTDAQSEVINTGFVDQVVDNHDARVLTNASGDIILLWTFLDRNTLVIATNEATLSEIVRRTTTSSLVPQP